MKIEINQAPLIRKFMETMRLMNIYLNHFPKHERYSLHKFNRAVARGNDATVRSLIAHAKDTASLGRMARALAGSQEMLNRLPGAHKARLAT